MSDPLRLPEGYGLRMQRGDPAHLVLERPNETVVAAFEFSATGPDPSAIMKIARDDAQRLEQGDSDLK